MAEPIDADELEALALRATAQGLTLGHNALIDEVLAPALTARLRCPACKELMRVPAWADHGTCGACGKLWQRQARTEPIIDPATGKPPPPHMVKAVGDEIERLDTRTIAKAVLAERDWTPTQAPISLRQAIDDAPDELPSRIERILPHGCRVILNGRRKMGKTTINTNVIRAVATGGKMFDRWQCSQGRVLMLNYEVLAHQFANWCDEAGVPLDDSYILSLRGAPNPLTSARGRRELESQIADLGIDLLIVDPLGAAASGVVSDESSNGEMRPFLDSLDEIVANSGVGELIVSAHLGKSGEDSRGASVIEDWPDVIWTLIADETNNRFFSAFGRDVDMPEEMLQFNHQNRRLSFTARAVNRANAGYVQAAALALEHVAQRPGCTLSEIRDVLTDGDVPGAAKNGAAGAWMTRLAREGELVQVRGPRNSKLHYLPADVPQEAPNA